jgi:hypothetical protein
MNNSLQLQHFFLMIPAIGNIPPDCQCYRKKGLLIFRNKMGKESSKKIEEEFLNLILEMKIQLGKVNTND